jgi:hypothetical protein
MKFKGTKGKWEINKNASRNVRCNNISIANCSAGQNGELEDEEIHNALLISKAPEMLEMLIICQQLTDNRTLYEDINKLIKEATEL